MQGILTRPAAGEALDVHMYVHTLGSAQRHARWATSVTSAACKLSAPAFADPPHGVYSMTGVV